MKYYQPHMTSLITDNTGPSRHYSLTVKLVYHHSLCSQRVHCVCVVCSALVLFDFSAEVGQLLLAHPTTVLAGMDTQHPLEISMFSPPSVQYVMSLSEEHCQPLTRPIETRHSQ